MQYVQAAMRGDIEEVARLSFECIMCGLCASRCPAEIVQYNVAILCRRLYAKYMAPKAKHVASRVKEIEAGKFDAERIAKAVKASGVEAKLNHKKLVIPGHVAVLLGEIEEELPGWKILVGPREAVQIPGYVKLWDTL